MVDIIILHKNYNGNCTLFFQRVKFAKSVFILYKKYKGSNAYFYLQVHFAEGAGIPPVSPLRAKPQVRRAASASGGEKNNLSLSSSNVEIIQSVTINAHMKYSHTDIKYSHNILLTDVMVEIEPSEELVFSNCNIGATATIVLTNPTNTPLAFKVSCTLIDRFSL